MRSLACISLFAGIACAPGERAEQELPSCHEPVDMPATVASTSDPLIDQGCFVQPTCEAVDGFAQLLDVDPNVPGPQYDCSVSDVQHAGTATEIQRPLPMCDNLNGGPSTNEPCWRIASDPGCPTEMNRLALAVVRDIVPPMGTTVIGSCAAECTVFHQVGRCAPPDP